MRILPANELKERMTKLYLSQFLRVFGINADPKVMERLAIADLELVDAARDCGVIRESSSRQKIAPPRPQHKRLDATPDVDAPKVASVPGDTPVDYRPKLLYASADKVDDKWRHCLARIARICEGTSVAKTHSIGADTAEMPHLARKFASHFGWFMLRTGKAPIKGVDHNPYRGLSDADAQRKFRRAIEDIADESSVKLGPWWVPK